MKITAISDIGFFKKHGYREFFYPRRISVHREKTLLYERIALIQIDRAKYEFQNDYVIG